MILRLFLFVFLLTFPAIAKDNYDPDKPHFIETGISAYCESVETFDRAIKLFLDGKEEEGLKLFNNAESNGECATLKFPFEFVFLGTEIVKRYSPGVNGEEIIIRGTIDGIGEVFVWDSLDNLNLFIESSEKRKGI